MSDLDWLILGGGPHGVHLAARLLGNANIDATRLKILDPGPRLLHRWRTFTTATGMTHLRSPGVHHLDLEPFSLVHFAGKRRCRPAGVLRGIYNRPALEHFNLHSDRVIERYGLDELHLRDEALRLEPGPDRVLVTTRHGGSLEPKRVVLAIGASGQPAWPTWAPKNDPRVRHIFEDPAPESEHPPVAPSPGEPSLLVIGGGISAAQLALRHATTGRRVDLVSRHRFRIHQFDSDPGWLGPKLMPTFRREKSPVGRRRLIHQARHRGSVTPEVRRALRSASASGRLTIHEDAVADLQVEGGGLRLELESGRMLEGTHLHLATGFARRRPGGPMIDRLVEDFELPCAPCGYPIVDAYLRWHPRIHVSGPLAELELGPVSRNIAGARRAGDRLVEAQPVLRAVA
ncbi:MAG: FAD/NAD(P)-binding protein [Acidobacteriota bacterium]